MNLSKVYSTQDTFEPEDIIRAKVNEPMVFGSILAERLPEPPSEPTSEKPEHTSTDAFQQEEEQTGEHSQQDDTLAAKDVASSTATPEPDQIPEPTPPAADPPPPPPEPQGMPADQVDQLLAESYEKGIQAGLNQAEEDYGAATSSLLLVCQQLDTLRETILKNSVSEIQELVLAIAEKVIRHSVQDQHTTIMSTIEEAIQKAVKSDEFDIYVHPDDYQIVASKSEELVASLNGLHSVLVKKDSSLDRGGCRIESDNCIVDATIISQLDIIRDNLKQQD